MDWVRFITLYGNYVAVAMLCGAAIGIYGLCRRGRGYAPRGFAGWAAVVVLLLLTIPAEDWLIRMGPKNAALKRSYQKQGQTAPALEFRLMPDGSVHHLAELQGKLVLVNVWATWCGPCRVEMPDLDRLQRAYADKGLVVLTISDETPEEIARYRQYASMAVMKGAVEEGGARDYIATGSARPVTYLVDRSGILRETYVGPHDLAFFSRTVDHWLAASAR
ncbi:redoxin domain-containing protein [Edaphobacter bradus]|uniref:redoxin domain-containing protein n=1 Tax=Edaphobacter bradus TaxID=2259016 RepID=UPI0021E05E5D|nr:TlpA disulfide reductase family protein [Edaphobacter bradus]